VARAGALDVAQQPHRSMTATRASMAEGYVQAP